MSRESDFELGASVRAGRLRFEHEPQAEVNFTGDPDLDTASHTERENLPEEVMPDVTYRDVRVRWRATARLPDAPEN